jgi:hypothetical protein
VHSWRLNLAAQSAKKAPIKKAREKKAPKANTVSRTLPNVKVQEKAVVDDVLDEDDGPSRRRVSRRDSDDQTDRYIERKLSHLSDAS